MQCTKINSVDLAGLAGVCRSCKREGAGDRQRSHRNESSLGKVSEFMEELENAGFTLNEGEVEYIDLVKQCCEGKVPDTLANNPWPNAYLTLKNLTPESYPQLSIRHGCGS